jgi:hypothetical protein
VNVVAHFFIPGPGRWQAQAVRAQAIHEKLDLLSCELHDAFGPQEYGGSQCGLMQGLMEIGNEARK